MSQSHACMTLTNAARVNTPPLGALQFPCPAACGGVIDYVAKCGSLTVAASVLSISQPAVSQAVKQLEEILDVKLFVRASRGVRLTCEGENLYFYVKRGYEEIELGEKKLSQMLNLESGELRIGASDMTLRFICFLIWKNITRHIRILRLRLQMRLRLKL